MARKDFATQTPEIHLTEIVRAGITTVVGTLGVDNTMKTMAGLLAKVKALKEEGLSAYLWSGGYSVPSRHDHEHHPRRPHVHRRGRGRW